MPEPQLPTNVNQLIAEWCGWKIQQDQDDKLWRVFTPAGHQWPDEHTVEHFENLAPDLLPKYDDDLNACAEFERLVKRRSLHSGRDLWTKYYCQLLDVLVPNSDLRDYNMLPPWQGQLLIEATAPQRCAALLKVMNA